jgi:hypothetical protein
LLSRQKAEIINNRPNYLFINFRKIILVFLATDFYLLPHCRISRVISIRQPGASLRFRMQKLFRQKYDLCRLWELST